MTKPQIVGLGLSTLDVLMRLKQMPTWERGSLLSDLYFDGGGPVGTALVAAARLGADVGYIGTRGNDSIAQLRMEYLTKEGIDVSQVVPRPTRERQIVICYVHEETGERVFSGTRGTYDDLLKVEELNRDYITSADYLHLEGFHPEAALQAAKWMQAAAKKVMLDAATTEGEIRPGFKELVEVTDVLIAGSGFVPALTGENELWAAGKAALELGPSIVVQTEGASGSYTTTRDDQFHVPAFDVDVLDTTGAGDVFHGAYLVGLTKGWDLRRITRFATAVSAIKCTRRGGRAGIPSYSEVQAFLQERGLAY
jgi:ribokinase